MTRRPSITTPRLLALFALLAIPLASLGDDAPATPAVMPAKEAVPSSNSDTFARDILPFLSQHCYHCHGNGEHKADLTLDKFKSDAALRENRKVWDGVVNMLTMGEMPPKERPRPAANEIAAVLKAIDSVLATDCTREHGPGRVTIVRLNKLQYNNTIRDLLGVDFQPAADFPGDDVGNGFDRIGDVLSMSPLLMEKYLAAAESIMDKAIAVVDVPKPSVSAVGQLRATPGAGGMLNNATYLNAKGDIGGITNFQEGEWVIKARIYAQQVGDEPVKAAIVVGGKVLQEFEVTATYANSAQTIQVRMPVKAVGSSRVGVALLNPYTAPKPEPPPELKEEQAAGDDPKSDVPKVDIGPAVANATMADGMLPPVMMPQMTQQRAGMLMGRGMMAQTPPPTPEELSRQRLLYVRSIDVDGPHNAPPPPTPEVHNRLMAHGAGLPRQWAREILTRFTTKAFRRPAGEEEVERILATYDGATKEGYRFENAMKLALCRVLVSPHFLFRIERDPADAKAGQTYDINDFELASRLSYFLWNTLPDDELFALAAKGELRKNLESQVRRMLKDSKSESFVMDFSDQWLLLRKMAIAAPDAKLFPTFNDELRADMVRETQLFFTAVVREDRSIFDLIDANFTFVNERLAKHYGLSGVKGNQFVRVELPASRGGVLTQASILTLTSHATRTAPVLRGKFVLEQLLGTPPPPPPPDVPPLDEEKQLTGSLRKVMEQHRENALCASCHQRMDPIGFAFENFDAIGVWREKDGEFDVDASGILPDGKTFNGPAELKAILKDKKDLFGRCLSEKMLTYALSRGVEPNDQCVLDSVLSALAKDNYRFSTLVLEVIKSEPFLKRTATGEKP